MATNFLLLLVYDSCLYGSSNRHHFSSLSLTHSLTGCGLWLMGTNIIHRISLAVVTHRLYYAHSLTRTKFRTKIKKNQEQNSLHCKRSQEAILWVIFISSKMISQFTFQQDIHQSLPYISKSPITNRHGLVHFASENVPI